MVQTATKMDWRKMGFKTEADYNKFLADKWEELKVKIEQHKDVFKRLADR